MNAKRRHINADEPLWLVVQQDNCSQCFEFSPDKKQPVIIGSSEAANVRVTESVPIACFLERDASSLWLIPADPKAELRLDTVALTEKRRIYTYGLLEVSGVELRLKVRDTPPTLRADARVRTDSEICDLHPGRLLSDIDQRTATTTIDLSALRAVLGRDEAPTMLIERSGAISAASTKTVEMGPIDFDAWFDGPSASDSDARADVVSASDNSGPITPKVVCDVTTEEARPMALPLVTGGETEKAPSEPQVRSGSDGQSAASTKLDVYKTIEISRGLYAEPTSSPARGATHVEAAPTAIAIAAAIPKSSDTTEFEVLRPLPLTTADFEKAAKSADGRKRTRQAPVEVLAKVGTLAKQRPLIVVGGAGVGAFVLVMFFLGVAHLMGVGGSSKQLRAQPVAGVASAASVTVSSARTGIDLRSDDAASEPAHALAVPSAVSSVGTLEAASSLDPSATEALPDPSVAVGHLSAGRLPEAEQAYRDLFARAPKNAAFRAAARMLARRNAPSCRAGKAASTSCPMVKP